MIFFFFKGKMILLGGQNVYKIAKINIYIYIYIFFF